ncbi:MAG: YidC/Oxa1 family insertase periplasmic-domain containing protein [Gemmatimonadaceae bacterium]|nr:YidC/Oxa1 family insertase periplasmic-domain containing protein [Gemmatimonadaceae bacterium]
MDKRFFLALVLTMGVIFVTPRLFPGPPRPVTPIAAADSTGRADTTAVGRSTGPAAPVMTAAPSVGPAAAPAGAPQVLPPARTARLAHALATYEFSSRGAAFLRAELPRHRRLGGEAAPVELRDGTRPLVHYRILAGGDTIPLDAIDFAATETADATRPRVTFTAPVGAGQVAITYTLSPSRYVTDLEVAATGLPAPSYLLIDLPESFESQEKDSLDDRRHLAYAMRTMAGGAERIDFRKPDPGERLVRQGPFTWAVAKNKYFLVGVLTADSTDSPLAEVQVTGAPRQDRVATRAHGTVVTRLASVPVRLELYAGPQEWEGLVAMGREFEHVNPYGGWLNSVVQPFATIVMRVLLWMKRSTALSYGWILVIFGVGIRLLLWPLNSRAMRSQMVMQRIAPLVQAAQAEAKAKHPTDLQKQQAMVMKVYADAGVSPFAPLAGCLPMLLPMPVLFALFFVFQNTIEFRGVPFLWFPDISVADPLYIAPLLTGGSMFLLSWLSMRNSPPNPQTKMLAWMMPLMMTVFGIRFAAGLNLYWFVQNFAAMPQQWMIANERAKLTPAPAPADAGERKRR